MNSFYYKHAIAIGAFLFSGPAIAQDNLISEGEILARNSGEPIEGGAITVALARDILNWNVTSAAGNNSVVRTATLPIVPSAFMLQPDLTLKMNSDLLVSAELTSKEPQVVVYTIREDAVWSDGTPISGDDFIYLWKTQNGRDCPECLINATDGHDFISSLEQDETGKVVTATFSEPFVGWQGLFMFLYPAHLAEQHGTLSESYNNWLGTEVPSWSGGPYMIESFDPGQLITMVPNPEWYGEKGPYLDNLNFRIITDASLQMTALENGEVDVVYPAGATQDMVQQAADLSYLGIDFQMNPAANWYFMGLNGKNGPTTDPVLRKAMFTALDASDMKARTADIYLQNWPLMGSVMFLPTQLGYEDHRMPLGFGTGNTEAAKTILSEAGYSIEDGVLSTPDGAEIGPLRLIHPQGYPAIGDLARLISSDLTEIGIRTEIVSGPNTTAQSLASGNYSMYMSYFSQQAFPAVKAAQVWKTGAGQNYFGLADPEVDALIDQAMLSTSIEESAEYLAQADRIASEAALLFPIYQLPTALIYEGDIVNLRDNPNQLGPLYNVSEWGRSE